MMMAHDSDQGREPLADETIAAVREALIAYAAWPTDGERLRVALHQMAVEAREKGMLPEQALVVLKDLWYSLPDIRATREQPDHIRLLQRIVTMCIREYYAD